MAAFDTTRTAYGAASVAGRTDSFLSGLLAAFAAWNDARQTRNALRALSDRELDDIGLSRADIESVCELR